MSNSFGKSRFSLAIYSAIASLVIVSGAAAADTPPRVDTTHPRMQEYPDSAQLNGEEGTVLVGVYVRPNGRPSKIRVERSSGFSDLDNAAVESVLNWRFVPARLDGDIVSDWTTVKIVYQLPRLPTQPPPG
jgi:protein TonB